MIRIDIITEKFYIKESLWIIYERIFFRGYDLKEECL